MKKEKIKIIIEEDEEGYFTVDFEGTLSLTQKMRLQFTLVELNNKINEKVYEHYSVLNNSIKKAKDDIMTGNEDAENIDSLSVITSIDRLING